MKYLFERIIHGRGGSFWGPYLNPLLAILSLIYSLGVKIRVFLYERRLFQSKSLPCKVVSVGNITIGGTGKTPLVIWLAEFLRAANYKPAVLSRGYKGALGNEVGVISDGHNMFLTPHDSGDEPYLMASKLKGVPVLTGKDRLKTGQYALKYFKVDLVILDDGYQYMELRRDLDLVLLDATNPLGNKYLLPRGPLREPISHLRRAHAFILTRCDQTEGLNETVEYLRGLYPETPVFKCIHKPFSVCYLGREEFFDPHILCGKKSLAFSGIAYPNAFLSTLKDIGTEVVQFIEYPDHYNYSRNDLEQIQMEASTIGVETIITTEKDKVRIEGRWPQGLPLSYLVVNMEFMDQTFQDFLIKNLKRGDSYEPGSLYG